MPLSFVDHLEQRLREAPPPQKRQRTNERLKLGAAKVLEQKGYHGLRVTDVTAIAETADGSFYAYFKDKTDITLTVLTELLEDFFPSQMSSPGSGEVFGGILAANRRWFELSEANSGLLRCILQISDEAPQFSRLFNQVNRRWLERVAQTVGQRREISPKAALLLGYMLGAMMDELVRKLIVYPDLELAALLDDLGADAATVVDAASLVWLKVLYPDEPRPDGYPPVVGIVADALAFAPRPA